MHPCHTRTHSRTRVAPVHIYVAAHQRTHNNTCTSRKFRGINMLTKEFEPLEKKVFLSSPTMHGDEQKYIKEAFDTNWVTTAGTNIEAIEKEIAEFTGAKYAVALGTGTSALHLCMKLAGAQLGATPGTPSLQCIKVACSDMTFSATVNPVKYEGGEQIFIDTERDTWNMDPYALLKAFELYPDIKVVVTANLYGTPGKMDEIAAICKKYGAILIEDAAESLGATYKGRQTGTFGAFNTISFNGNKIITGSSGGMLLTDDEQAALRARKWSTQSRDRAAWYQHEEIGYNYRMSNIVAGVVRGQFPHLQEHIAQKKAIYERYKKGFYGLPVSMNPFDEKNSEPNYWLSCMLIDQDAMCPQARDEHKAVFCHLHGKSCPTEILQALTIYGAEGRPIWKPMHMQPLYRNCPFVTIEGNGRNRSDAYVGFIGNATDVGADIFERGLCLPSDNKMTPEEQDKIIEIIRACFE